MLPNWGGCPKPPGAGAGAVGMVPCGYPCPHGGYPKLVVGAVVVLFVHLLLLLLPTDVIFIPTIEIPDTALYSFS